MSHSSWATLQQGFSKSSTRRVKDKAGLALRWGTDCAELLPQNISAWLVSGALGWKFLSLASVINFSSADIMMYSCTGRRLYLPTLPLSNYSHVHLGAAGLPNVSFIPLLVKPGQLHWFWFLVCNSGWHLIQLESVLPVSLKNDKKEWKLPTIIQGNTWHLLLFMLPSLFGICIPISFCKMSMFCLLGQFGTDAPSCSWPLNLQV